jgi:hypothetical protein
MLLIRNNIEKQVIENVKEHMKILYSAASVFREAIEKDNKDLMLSISAMEKEADIIKRKIISDIYEGAFFPYQRPNVLRFVEIVAYALSKLEMLSSYYPELVLDEAVKKRCIRISDINLKMSEMLLVCFGSLIASEDLKVKGLVISLYGKKVNEVALKLYRDLKQNGLTGFFSGLVLFHFISVLNEISNMIERASFRLQIIEIAMR